MKFFLFVLFFQEVSFSSQKFVAWGSTNSIVKAPIRENFLSGFQLGLESELGKGSFEKYIKTYSEESGVKIGAIDIAKKAVAEGAVALIGFPGSHDALLAAGVAKELEVVAISPGCNHQRLADFGDLVHTTGHSGFAEVESSIWFFNKRFKGNGLIVVNPKGAPSSNMGEIFKKKILDGLPKNVKYSFAELNNDLSLSSTIIDDLKSGKYGYIVFTPYPDDLGNVTKQLTDLKIDLPTLAGSAWGTVDSDLMRRYVVSKRSPFYMMTSWSSESRSGKSFIAKFKQKFAKTPSADSAYGYDLGVMVGQVVKRIPDPLNKQNFRKALSAGYCFSRLSIGRLCLSKTGGHAKRAVFFLKFTPKGYVPVDKRDNF